MSNFKIAFMHPWLLLFLIPIIALILGLHFRLSKKFRRTRNRIVSLVLSICFMILCISVLAGTAVAYEKSNLTNEILFLVDVSFSNKRADDAQNQEDKEDKRDKFIQDVLEKSVASEGIIYYSGIVLFARGTPVYAAELSTDTVKVFADYKKAVSQNDNTMPVSFLDDSATEIAAALKYTAGLFNNPKTAKIVLITDGIETDGSAASTIMSITAEGIMVDMVYFGGGEIGNEVQIIATEFPDDNINLNEPINIGLTVQSSFEGSAELTVYENGEESSKTTLNFLEGTYTFEISHTFAEAGPKELHFVIDCEEDTLQQNNSFYSYLFVEIFDKILLLHREDDTTLLEGVLSGYNVTKLNINDAPETVDELREYDQVILMNIANSDMRPAVVAQPGVTQAKPGFIDILESYVSVYGGGVLTVGGNENNNVSQEYRQAHAYKMSDMRGTTYQRMLPIECIDYTPPFALMIIIDRSFSMNTLLGGKSYLELAKDGAIRCVNSLSDRDYVGVITLETDYKEEIPCTPVTQKSKVLDAIASIRIGNDQSETGAINMAGRSLLAVRDVERRHILFVTDGVLTDSPKSLYLDAIKHFYDTAGITLSVVATNAGSEIMTAMGEVAGRGNGHAYNATKSEDIPGMMLADISIPDIKDYVPEEFKPTIKTNNHTVAGILESNLPLLGGFYGTRAKVGAEVSLMGQYVPIYAQWDYGKGRVGSVMTDLNGIWSDKFMIDPVGIKFINNVIKGLFPRETIRPKDIDAVIRPDNYSTHISVLTGISEGDSVKVTVTAPDESSPQVLTPGEAEGFSRCTFNITEAGMYKILIQKTLADGTLSEYTTYSTFSYSAEYNAFPDWGGLPLLEELAQKSEGSVIVDDSQMLQVFAGFEPIIKKTFDLRWVFIITAVILFLLDIAVRKFKFKWPWEIVKDRKIKAELKRKLYAERVAE